VQIFDEVLIFPLASSQIIFSLLPPNSCCVALFPPPERHSQICKNCFPHSPLPRYVKLLSCPFCLAERLPSGRVISAAPFSPSLYKLFRTILYSDFSWHLATTLSRGPSFQPSFDALPYKQKPPLLIRTPFFSDPSLLAEYIEESISFSPSHAIFLAACENLPPFPPTHQFPPPKDGNTCP